jgi:CHAP domain
VRSHLVVTAALVAALAANWAVAGSAGAATSTNLPAARSSLSPATQRDLLRLFAGDRGIPVADIAGIAPGAVLGPRASAGRDWAMVSFRPVAHAPGAVKLLLQDGGGTGVFTKSAGHSWTLAGLGGAPAGCGGPIPAPVRRAWHLPSCQAQAASRVPAPESAAAGTATGLANIALAQVGVADNPASTSFSDDCDPYTTLVGNPDGAPDCGTTTSNGSWFSNAENANEEWCADFTKWVWERAGVTSDLGVLTPSAASFYTWGADHGEKISFGGTPEVGDAVLFYPAGTSAPNGSYADHVGIVASINSDGSLNLVDGDFLGSSNISVQYNTDVSGPSWFASGEEWAFVSPQLPTASAPAPSLIGFVTPSGALYVKERGLSTAWTREEPSGVASFALASDGVNGPLIGFVSTSGAFYVKKGGLSTAWTREESSGVASIALASDGVNGPLIGFKTTSGAFYVKKGGLSTAWTQEEPSGVASIALASDGVNGPLIGFVSTSGAFYVKEHGLSTAWTQEEPSGVASIALASDGVNGPLIGFKTTSGAFYVKEHGLSTAWTQEEPSGVASIALASDGANGPLIGFKTTSGAFYVKKGGLSTAWTQEEPSGVASIALAPGSGD